MSVVVKCRRKTSWLPNSRKQKTKSKSEEVTEKADLGGYGKSNSSCVCVCDGEALRCDPTLSAIAADLALICSQKCCKKQLHTRTTYLTGGEKRAQVSKTAHQPSSWTKARDPEMSITERYMFEKLRLAYSRPQL